ncbi:MAG TPA: maltotransferase domain-containing protein [Acidobacteriaceae bacterium]|nr:maltotransferase domain-containing protein [Acidobacteriaceae bacterium]
MTNDKPSEMTATEKSTAKKTTAAAKRTTVAASKPSAAASTKPVNGRSRVVVEGVTPQIDGGRFAIKRVSGDQIRVEADVFGDGHDLVRARLLYRHASEAEWRAEEMTALGNDHWAASFPVDRLGFYEYTVVGEIDHFVTWRSELKKRQDAGQDLDLPMKTGALLIESTATRAAKDQAAQLRAFAAKVRAGSTETAFDDALLAAMKQLPETDLQTRYEPTLRVWVDRERARFSSWYELFPRSWGKPGQHGTLRDVAAQLDYVEEMGFDVLYLPPIHPIGRSFRKGKNNTTEAKEGDVGSPWAIGAKEGGHLAILRELGTFEDLDYLIQQLHARKMELALDIAFQCAPDHPWVTEHPEWFKKRADGSIQYAENPPKKYQDIYPLDFESSDWQGLWDALKEVFIFWAEKGVRIFRVDNPHTKAFPFWEWVIAEVQTTYPDAIFLAEAFTRPRVMERLAKLGYTQSYTYFTWRNTKAELTEYMTELTKTDVAEYMRPNFWPNTPDILPFGLQTGGPNAFKSRLVLAATLSSNYGMYGPAFELGENIRFKEGSEEYLNSEKYEIKRWNRDAPNSLRPLITLLNEARRANRALQRNESLVFHPADNAQIIAYSKATEDGGDVVLTIVNLDPVNTQAGFVTLDLARLGLNEGAAFDVFDLLANRGYRWQGSRNYVELRPYEIPAHVFRVTRS